MLEMEGPETRDSGPVTCLGTTFPNDAERRKHFLGILREKLKDPEFRKIEGFPIGSDEDILALSDPPYYTACPNPFIADFIKQYGKPYDPNEPYSREPFAADVSEGKNDPIYNAHSYHTKVPHKAIMRYILHYTEPGDVIFDGFCGTGMTGVAAQLCRDKVAIESLGYKVDMEGTISQQDMYSQQEWDKTLIECEIIEIVEEDISSRFEVIHNALSPAHLDQQVVWIEQRIQHSVENGNQLWRSFSDFFPGLICCPAIEEQMAGLPACSLASITRGLFRLNAYCTRWRSGAFEPHTIGCAVSPESPTTLEVYGAERTFLCPDGQNRIFSWHAKVGRWRIYFDPGSGPGSLLLGYVGKHLRTIKYG